MTTIRINPLFRQLDGAGRSSRNYTTQLICIALLDLIANGMVLEEAMACFAGPSVSASTRFFLSLVFFPALPGLQHGSSTSPGFVSQPNRIALSATHITFRNLLGVRSVCFDLFLAPQFRYCFFSWQISRNMVRPSTGAFGLISFTSETAALKYWFLYHHPLHQRCGGRGA